MTTRETPNLKPGDKALVTTDNWFYGPDGKSYRAVFGTIKGVRTAEESLRVRTNARSTNWYLEIGCVTLGGCQIHYIVRCEKANFGRAQEWTKNDQTGVVMEYERPSAIFDADAPA